MQWQLGTAFSCDTLRARITQMYINFEADGTWARELAEVSQIIALATQVKELSSKLNDTVALATEVKKQTVAEQANLESEMASGLLPSGVSSTMEIKRQTVTGMIITGAKKSTGAEE